MIVLQKPYLNAKNKSPINYVPKIFRFFGFKTIGVCVCVVIIIIIIIIVVVSFILIRKRFFLSHIYRNRLFRPLTYKFYKT